MTLGKLLELMGTMGESPEALRDPKNIQVLAGVGDGGKGGGRGA